jgi:hypothetical protein
MGSVFHSYTLYSGSVFCGFVVWRTGQALMLAGVIRGVYGERRYVGSRKRSVLLIDSHLYIYVYIYTFYFSSCILNVV